MADITSWLKKNLSSFEPDEFLALNAMRHLGKSEHAKLFSPEIEKMRTAEAKHEELTGLLEKSKAVADFDFASKLQYDELPKSEKEIETAKER